MAQTTTRDNFTSSAKPKTDLWRQPPSTNVNNIPFEALAPSMPLAKFESAGVTFNAQWTKRFDQGGVALFLSKEGWAQGKWVKSGVEFFKEKPYLSSVTTDNWSDWSLAPVTGPQPRAVTIEARRETHELGTSLWIYQLVLDDSGQETDRVPLRECAWPFADEDGVTVEVGTYAARPAEGEEGELLEVKFEKAWVTRSA